MKIESTIQRDGGTHVPMGTTSYHFEPLADGAHVAEVADDAHIARFLSIPEGFRMYRPGQAAAAPVAPQPVSAPVAAPAKSLGFPATFDIGGKLHTLKDVIDLAIATSELGIDNWNELPDSAQVSRIEAELDKLEAAGDAAALEQLMAAPAKPEQSRDELVKLHVEKFGSKPHHKWSAERIREALGA